MRFQTMPASRRAVGRHGWKQRALAGAMAWALLRKIEHPILLAPMGGASGGKLAAAVSGAGGLGMLNVIPFRTAAKGNEERFPPRRLTAGCRFRKETIAGMRRNGRDAP
jgi:hypothetical protein